MAPEVAVESCIYNIQVKSEREHSDTIFSTMPRFCVLNITFVLYMCYFSFMPPTSKKLKGHIGLVLSVCAWVCLSVTLCIWSRTARDRILKFNI